MVINARMARTLFPDRDPLGQLVAVDMFNHTITFEVVGVVGDVRLQFVGDEVPMTMYLSYRQFPDTTLRLAIRTDQEPATVLRAVRRLVQARDRSIPVENLVSMERIVGESLAPQQATATLTGLLAVVAVLLASIGLYGVLAYAVIQRTREIGLRMALGAQPRDVLRLVMRQGVALTSIGVVIGVASAAGLTRLLDRLLFGVQPTDALTFSAVSLGMLAVALVAAYLPARRAAHVDPMEALRHD
jgi:putative ABC transport system permease protein